MAAVTIHSDFGAQENKACHCFHFPPFCMSWSDGTGCHYLNFFFSLKCLFIGCAGSLLLHLGFLWLCEKGLLSIAACALLCGDFCCGAQAPGARAAEVAACGLRSCDLRALACWLSSVAHRLSCSAKCEIFPDQRSNRCPLHCKVDS